MVARRGAAFLGNLGMVYGLSGQREEALAFLHEARQRAQAGEYISPLCVLSIHTGLNDLEGVHADLFSYLQEAGNGFNLAAVLRPFLGVMAAHPSFAELLRKMKLLA